MIVTNTEQIVGMRIKRVYGLAMGNTMRARHVGRDIMAVFRMLVGGEITEYTKMIAESREQSLDRMKQQTKEMGANAVVNVRFTTSAIAAGAAELLAYGTAVEIEPVE
ncbi:MAG: YbjQ family protein [Candidatus Lernaella stagnicola]|nr:YbjQ family protein [Candidatus Lernaella stagnicola]